MDLFLKIVGGLALLFGLFVVLVLFWLWRKLRAMARGEITAPPPSTIELVVDSEPDWTKQGNAPADLSTLESHGYVRGPAYTVEGIDGVSLVGLVHPETGVLAAYYEHPQVGNWVDFCAEITGGPEVTITNAKAGHQLDHRPGTEKNYHAGKSVAELQEILVARLAGQPVRKVALAQFREEFEAAYAREMVWRNQKDGTSEVEFMRIAGEQKKPLTEEQLRAAFRETKLGELNQRSEEVLATFEKTTTLPVAEWKKFENRMFMFRDNFHPDAYLDYLGNTVALSCEDTARYREVLAAGLSLKGMLDRIAKDTGQQFVKLGDVSEPIAVEIFGVIAPKSEESAES